DGRLGNANCPSSLVSTRLLKFVCWLMTVTSAPLATDLVSSVTLPTREPYSTCALAVGAKATKNNKADRIPDIVEVPPFRIGDSISQKELTEENPIARQLRRTSVRGAPNPSPPHKDCPSNKRRSRGRG